MKKYIMALDAGTTSARCILFDKAGNICSMAQKEIRQIYPHPGWVEQDPAELWESQLEVAREALKKIGAGPEDVASIGITNQRETSIVWDRHTGKPVYNAIVWQCRRTADFCRNLKEKGLEITWREKTGLLIDAYFSGTKVRWILDHAEGAREAADRGDLLFGTVDTWLIWNLTGGKVHATDYSNASRTLLFNIREGVWDQDILRELEIPESMLPEVKSSSGLFGESLPELLGASIPIAGAAGDQQAALFGQACFEPGDVKNTYGTGGFLLMNTGTIPSFSRNGLVTTIAWGMDGKIEYALEGSVFVAGAAIQWLRDELGLIQTAAESEDCARRVPDTNGCYLVPAFTGLGAPYWDPYARGTLVGLTRGVNRDHIVRATIESMAYQVRDVLKAMEGDFGGKISSLRVDGGACANDFLLQFQADILDVPVRRPSCVETTALGAAYLAGLAVGFWKDKDEVKANWAEDKRFHPEMKDEIRQPLLAGWQKAVGKAGHWID
ncbi:MAG: glycerol kinase GlpK [Clostridiales bacterium]|nr:glycerol kinase GlpK [Clostridiales bacterium]